MIGATQSRYTHAPLWDKWSASCLIGGGGFTTFCVLQRGGTIRRVYCTNTLTSVVVTE